MAIIYSYPTITNLETTDLFIISRLPEDPEEISNYSVTLNSLSTYIIDKAFNGTDNYIPKFDGTASLVNSIIYQDDDGHVGIGVPGSTPNPVHKFEVYDDRSENVSSDYTQVNSTVVGPPWTGGAGGVLSRLSTDGGSTFPYGISLIPGTTASDLAASGRLGFFSNSNLDTNAATGYSGQVTFDGTDPHWILGGNLTDTTARTLHVKGDMLVDTDLEVDGGLDVAGTVRLGFTGNDPVILGNPTGKRTEWNNPGYFEIYAENPDSPGNFNETVDIDGEFLGGGYLGVYPVRTENRHGVRMHSRNATGIEANYIDIASVESSAVYDENQIRLITAVDGIGTYAGIKISHPTDNRFRFNSEFNTEPTVPFLVNDNVKINGSLSTTGDLDITKASARLQLDSSNAASVINLRGGTTSQNHLITFGDDSSTSTTSAKIDFKKGIPGSELELAYGEPVSGFTNSVKIRATNTYFTDPLRIGADSTANELDDYEEGTFTPTISSYIGGSITPVYNSQLGEYTKVGNIVTASISLSLDTSTTFSGTGDLIFGGLPYGIKQQGSVGGQVSGNLSYFRKFDDAAMGNFVGARRSVASTTVSLNKAVQVGSAPPDDKSIPITTADMVNTGSFYGDFVIAFTITYRT